MNRGLTLLMVLVVMILGLAMAQTGTTTTGTLDERAAQEAANILCPIVMLLTGTLMRLVIIVLLAAAIATYFLVDARAAKATAITLAIGTLLVLTSTRSRSSLPGITWIRQLRVHRSKVELIFQPQRFIAEAPTLETKALWNPYPTPTWTGSTPSWATSPSRSPWRAGRCWWGCSFPTTSGGAGGGSWPR
jgi:type II secretory pathway pseudopilin PulG